MTTTTQLRREGLPDNWEELIERDYQKNIHLLEAPGWSEDLLRAVTFMNIRDHFQCGHMKSYRELIECICEGDDDESES